MGYVLFVEMSINKDKHLMAFALEDFHKRAAKKFYAGIKEHNPDGSKGLARMPTEKLIECCQEEAIDLWFYLAELHRRSIGKKMDWPIMHEPTQHVTEREND